MIVVFVGPSLDQESVHRVLRGVEARVLPPAAQGDVYRAWRSRPEAIVLIDGYFGEVAAVWHKEILWALSQGTPVIGGASIGALRAAELESFGMVGVGEVFKAFRNGVLVADDEVALAHGDVSTGYRNLSEPLVNIRATLASALTQGVVSESFAGHAIDAARVLFYAERSYHAILAGLEAHCEVAALRAWLPTGRVDQKARDAEAVLREVAEGVDAPMVRQSWSFEYTAMWDEATRLHATRALDAHARVDDDLLDRFEHDAEASKPLKTAALARLLAGDLARRLGRAVDETALLDVLVDLRHRHELLEPSQLARWMDENDLSTDGLAQLLTSEVHLSWVLTTLAADLEPHVLDELRLSGEYPLAREGKGASVHAASRI